MIHNSVFVVKRAAQVEQNPNMFACHHVIAFGILISCALALEAGTYENPVINRDCPDPGVYYDNSTNRYFTATTGTGHFPGGYFPIYTSEVCLNS
jgi:hypothetical protein